jgi:glucuronosyltransferase
VIFGGCNTFDENALRLSHIYRDQPRTSIEQAVNWTEYVIRHKGAPHLRSAALDLTWYQYFLLDVIAVLALAVGSVVLIVFVTLRLVSKRVWGVKNN